MADAWPDVPCRSWGRCPLAAELLPGVLREARAKVDTIASSGFSSLSAFPAGPVALGQLMTGLAGVVL